MTGLPSIFKSTDTGAPTLNNVVGSWNVVLKACLQTGYNSRSVTSIVVYGGVATATASAHGFSEDYAAHVLIEGAPDALLNGKKQPGGVTANTFTFPAVGVADGTYTGTITAKRAPLGWTETFNNGAGISTFLPDSVEASGKTLRVDDSHVSPAANTYARIIGCDGVTGVDAFSSPFPTGAQLMGGHHLQKGTNSATPKNWIIIGSDRFVYLLLDFGATGGVFSWFGDVRSFYEPDIGKCGIFGGINATAGSIAPSAFAMVAFTSNSTNGPFLFRDYTGAVRFSEVAGQCGPSVQGALGAGNTIQSGLLPTYAVENNIYLSEGPYMSQVVRGTVPGLCCPLALQPAAHKSVVFAGNGAVYFVFWGSPGGSKACAFIRLDLPWHE